MDGNGISVACNGKNCPGCVFNNVFSGKLDSSELAELEQFKSGKIYSKGEMIIHQGESVTHFMYLNSGLVKLYVPGKSGLSDRIISISKPMDCIGLMSIFSNPQYIYSVSALEDSHVCFIELDALRKMIEKNGKFAMCFLEKISLLSDHFLNDRIQIASKHMRGRVASIILFFASSIYNSNTFELPVSRKEIAELVDMRTENVIRVMSEFRHDQLIDIEGKNITIKNLEALEKISKLG